METEIGFSRGEQFFNSGSEQPERLLGLLEEENIQPKSIFTPIKEDLFPDCFEEKYPEAQITTLQGYTQKHTNIQDLITENRIDLFFLSNILDSKEPEEAESIAKFLARNKIPFILFTHYTSHDPIDRIGAFKRILERAQYTFKDDVNYADIHGREYHLAIANTK